MNINRIMLKISMISLLILSVFIAGCGALGGDSQTGEVELPLFTEPVEPPPQATAPQPEPTTPIMPTQAPEEIVPVTPPPAGDEGFNADKIITALLIIILIIIVLGVIVWIISLFTRSDKKAAEPAPAPVAQPVVSQPITENTHLMNASPAVRELYSRYVELIKSYGPVSIIPTESRIDFQARTIFSSVSIRLESLEIQLILPRIVQDERIIRVDTIAADKYSHLVMVDKLDDYDAKFNAWLGDSYNQGS